MKVLSELKPKAGAIRKSMRRGRGPGSGSGTTGGRGNNGNNARSGARRPIGFEGGQLPLTRSLPKRGFHNLFRSEYQVINLGDIDKKAAGQSKVDPDAMVGLGLIKNASQPVKILGDGTLSIPLTIKAHAFSASALEKIKNANGKSEVIQSVKRNDKE